MHDFVYVHSFLFWLFVMYSNFEIKFAIPSKYNDWKEPLSNVA